MVSIEDKVVKSHENFLELITNFVFSIAPTDGQVPWVARPSAGTELNKFMPHINSLVQEGCNSSVLAMELRLSCINPLIYS